MRFFGVGSAWARVMGWRSLLRPAADMWWAGLAAFILAAAYSWRPSFWFDETATIAAVNRSPAELVRMLGNLDTVHAVYYFLMQLWFAIVPINEFTARLPSAAAVGAGAAGLIKLGTVVADRQTAWAAAIAFMVLPRIAWAGVEARSYALATALAIWATVAFAVATARGGRARWALYAVVLALAVMTFVYNAMLIAAYVLTVAIRRQTWRAVPGFAAATVTALAMAAPVMYVAFGQRGQVSWIDHMPKEDLTTVLLSPWFMDRRGIAIAVGLLLIAGGIALARRTEARPVFALWLAAAWCIMPVALLTGYSIVVRDMYQPRYIVFTTPGLALALGLSVAAIAHARHWVTATLLAILVLAATPAYLVERGRYPKPNGADYSATARVIAANAYPGDCVIFDLYMWWAQASQRIAADAVPGAFAGLVDLTAGASGIERDQLWAAELDWKDPVVAERFAGCQVVWAITTRDRARPGGYVPPINPVSVANDHGFVSDRLWELNLTAVVRMHR